MPDDRRGNFLTQRIGPLPTWAWLAIMTMIAIVIWLFVSRRHPASQQPQQIASESESGGRQVTVNVEPPDEPGRDRDRDDDDRDRDRDDKRHKRHRRRHHPRSGPHNPRPVTTPPGVYGNPVRYPDRDSVQAG